MEILLYEKGWMHKEALDMTQKRAIKEIKAVFGIVLDHVENECPQMDETARNKFLKDEGRLWYEQMAWSIKYSGQVPADWLLSKKIAEDLNPARGELRKELVDALVNHPSKGVVNAVAQSQYLTPRQFATIIARSKDTGVNKYAVLLWQTAKGFNWLKHREAEEIVEREGDKLRNSLYEQELPPVCSEWHRGQFPKPIGDFINNLDL